MKQLQKSDFRFLILMFCFVIPASYIGSRLGEMAGYRLAGDLGANLGVLVGFLVVGAIGVWLIYPPK